MDIDQRYVQGLRERLEGSTKETWLVRLWLVTFMTIHASPAVADSSSRRLVFYVLVRAFLSAALVMSEGKSLACGELFCWTFKLLCSRLMR